MSDAPLTPVDEARAAVEAAVHPTPPTLLPLASCWRRVLTADLDAPLALPPSDSSAMDGFAVRAEDVAGARPDAPVALTVVGRSHAGRPPAVPCAPGDAVEIATGGMLPSGADAVVRLEEARRDGDRVLVTAPVAPGRDVRRRGEDVARGDPLLRAGQRLGITQLAAAAAAGIDALPVHRPARVSIVLTGDEVSRSGALEPGQVPDALGVALELAVTAEGGEAVLLGPVGDDDTRLHATLAAIAGASDLIVTVGGASVGPRDRLAPVLAQLGRVTRYRLALRPGKPFVLGRIGVTTVLGLPGNPAAALAAFELLARPALAQLGGATFRPEPRRARLTAPVGSVAGRLHLVRGTVRRAGGGLEATPLVTAGAGAVGSLAAATVWIVVPADADGLAAGSEVEVRPVVGHDWGSVLA